MFGIAFPRVERLSSIVLDKLVKSVFKVPTVLDKLVN